MEFNVPMDDLFRVTIVDSLRKLKHDFKHLELWDLAVFEPLPVVIQLSTREVLHHHNQSLLLRLGHGVH